MRESWGLYFELNLCIFLCIFFLHFLHFLGRGGINGDVSEVRERKVYRPLFSGRKRKIYCSFSRPEPCCVGEGYVGDFLMGFGFFYGGLDYLIGLFFGGGKGGGGVDTRPPFFLFLDRDDTDVWKRIGMVCFVN